MIAKYTKENLSVKSQVVRTDNAAIATDCRSLKSNVYRFSIELRNICLRTLSILDLNFRLHSFTARYCQPIYFCYY